MCWFVDVIALLFVVLLLRCFVGSLFRGVAVLVCCCVVVLLVRCVVVVLYCRVVVLLLVCHVAVMCLRLSCCCAVVLLL